MKFIYLSIFLIGFNLGCSLDPMQRDAEKIVRLTFELTSGLSDPDISRLNEYQLLGKEIEAIGAKYSKSPEKEQFEALVEEETIKFIQNTAKK
jgi:hypothetical protein